MNGDNRFNLKKKYDLLQKDTQEEFFNEASKHLIPYVNDFNKFAEVINFNAVVINKGYFIIEGGRMCSIRSMMKHNVGFDFFDQVWPTLYFMFHHQSMPNFKKLLRNLNNITQVSSTLFEIRCMQLFEKNGWSLLEYEPAVYEGLKRKNPEFVIRKNGFELFVECKSVNFSSSKAFKQFNRRVTEIDSVFNQSDLNELNRKKIRIEIQFDRLPSGKNIKRFLERIQDLKNKNELYKIRTEEKIDAIKFVVREQKELAYFSFRSIRSARIQVGPVARKLSFNNDEPYEVELSVSSHDLYKRQAKIAANLITQAKKQLPGNKASMIVLDGVKNPLADEPTKVRFETKDYLNIIAIVVNPFHDCWSRYQIDAKDKLASLFEGLPNGNPFK